MSVLFWVLASCSFVGLCLSFRETYSLISVLKMKTACSSETFALTYETTQCQNQKQYQEENICFQYAFMFLMDRFYNLMNLNQILGWKTHQPFFQLLQLEDDIFHCSGCLYLLVKVSHFSSWYSYKYPLFQGSYLCGVATRHFSNWYSQNTAPLTLPVAVKVSSSCSTCLVEFGLDGVAALPSAWMMFIALSTLSQILFGLCGRYFP